jgi:hypothetical protein
MLGLDMRTLFVAKSANRKTGEMPVTYNERKTCPPTCPHYEDDCYGEDFHTSLAWNRAPTHGLPLKQLTDKIRALPEGQAWRHAVAGDLWGKGEQIDAYALGEVVKANMGRKGFTYTHKKSPEAIKWIRHANQWGFTINLSALGAHEADALAELNAAPVVCVVPSDTPTLSKTPAGRTIVVCPAQTSDDVTCLTCQLCQKADRKSIVGFRAHGSKAKITDAKARRVIPIHIGA